MSARHTAGRRGRILPLIVILCALLALTLVTIHNVRDSRPAQADAPPQNAAATTSEPTDDPTSAPSTSPAPRSVHTIAAIARARESAASMTLSRAGIDAKVAALGAPVGASGYSVAAVNLVTGATYSAGATGGMYTGSVIKLDIIETLFLQHQDKGTPLSSGEVSNATTMIENSSNSAAEYLWEDIGSDKAVTVANQRLGPMANTIPGTDDYWGLTATNSPDQLKLLKNLVATGGPLTAASQSFILNLMSHVESDQRWGVGVTADAGTTFENKNGWLAVDDDGDRWLTNSVGIVTIDGQKVLMAVMTQHNQSFNAGVALVQALAKAIEPAVTS